MQFYVGLYSSAVYLLRRLFLVISYHSFKLLDFSDKKLVAIQNFETLHVTNLDLKYMSSIATPRCSNFCSYIYIEQMYLDIEIIVTMLTFTITLYSII